MVGKALHFISFLQLVFKMNSIKRSTDECKILWPIFSSLYTIMSQRLHKVGYTEDLT